ncbi:MAG: signal transduction histidine kinase [uncultured archaeon A07HR67]|nr:MAG: signal transduction histidine kinase [uncultured archaeon A07HR67]
MRNKLATLIIPYVFPGAGILFALVMCVEAYYVAFVSNPLGSVWTAGFVTSLPFVLGIVYTGVWLPNSDIASDRYTRVGAWFLGGLGASLLINLVIMSSTPLGSRLELVSWIRWAATIGGGVGLLIGTFETRSINRAVQMERERVRAEEAEANERLLEYLNATLRHEVLNSANVIDGHAELVRAEHDGSRTASDHIDTIQSRAREIESVIEDVRVLLDLYKNDGETTPTDITALLRTEIDTLRAAHDNVSVDTSMPEEAVIAANQPLRRAFANLLRNAVEHNDSDVPRVEVAVHRDTDTVSVRIADNGPGIPEAKRDTILSRDIRHDTTHGLGLTLTQTLVESYDGTIELTDTGPDGTVFTLTFPRHGDRVTMDAP